MRWLALCVSAVVLSACAEGTELTEPDAPQDLTPALSRGHTGVIVVNGWYEGEEIYYHELGTEEGVTERGGNDLYLIGGPPPRLFQANVAEFIPGEPGYSPHWNINVVHTAPGVTTADIVASPYVSEHYPEALFDDVADILAAEAAGLVTIDDLPVVVLCPVVPEPAFDAPGTNEIPEDDFVLDEIPETF